MSGGLSPARVTWPFFIAEGPTVSDCRFRKKARLQLLVQSSPAKEIPDFYLCWQGARRSLTSWRVFSTLADGHGASTLEADALASFLEAVSR